MTDAEVSAERTGVVVDDAVDGLGAIVGDLFATNLEDTARQPLLKGRPWSVAVDVYDAESVFVITLGAGEVHVGPGPVTTAQLAIRLDGDTLMEIPETPLLAGLPDPRSSAGRTLLKKILIREVRIKGLVLHLMLLRRFLQVLTTA